MEDKIEIKFPYKKEELSLEETKEMLNYFNSDYLTTFLRLGSKGYFFYKQMEANALDVYNMTLRPSDSFVVTCPRSGTTWTQELVWLLQNDLDFEKAKSIPLVERFPFMEIIGFFSFKFPDEIKNRPEFKEIKEGARQSEPKALKDMPSPRFIKSHMPLSLLPPSLLDTVKVVYVARDPRDVAVSNFFHLRSLKYIPDDAEFKPFWKFFLEDKIPWAPYLEHVKEAWRQRDHPNMAFIFYEELNKDLAGVAKRLAKFFGKNYTEEQIAALCDHLKFDNFQKNESVNMAQFNKGGFINGNFIRKGKSGGWRDHFDEEMTQQADRWMAENMRDTDLRFPQVA